MVRTESLLINLRVEKCIVQRRNMTIAANKPSVVKRGLDLLRESSTSPREPGA
jgi:hypothetical protein